MTSSFNILHRIDQTYFDILSTLDIPKHYLRNLLSPKMWSANSNEDEEINHGTVSSTDSILDFGLIVRRRVSNGSIIIEVDEFGSKVPKDSEDASWLESNSGPLGCSIKVGPGTKEGAGRIWLGADGSSDDTLTTKRIMMVLALYPMNLEQWGRLFCRIIPGFKSVFKDMFHEVPIAELYVSPPTWDELIKARYLPEDKADYLLPLKPRIIFPCTTYGGSYKTPDHLFHLLFHQALNVSEPLKKHHLTTIAAKSLREQFKLVTNLVLDKKKMMRELNAANQDRVFTRIRLNDQLVIDGILIEGRRMERPLGCPKETWKTFEEFMKNAELKQKAADKAAEKRIAEDKAKRQADIALMNKRFNDGIAATKKLAGIYIF